MKVPLTEVTRMLTWPGRSSYGHLRDPSEHRGSHLEGLLTELEGKATVACHDFDRRNDYSLAVWEDTVAQIWFA